MIDANNMMLYCWLFVAVSSRWWRRADEFWCRLIQTCQAVLGSDGTEQWTWFGGWRQSPETAETSEAV